MQQFAVIGLGRFGSRLAANLTAAGQEVIAIDKRNQPVEEIRDRVTLAVAMDCTDEQALRSQGVDKVDVAIVGISSRFEDAALATAILKQIGVPRVISRAATTTLANILRRIGADEIVKPEDESADRWAIKLANPWFMNYIELDAGHSIVDVNVPTAWVGKTLGQLHLRTKLGVHVVAIKHPTLLPSGQMSDRSMLQIPRSDQPLNEKDILVILGPDDKITHLHDEELSEEK